MEVTVAAISVTEGNEVLYISNSFIRLGLNLKTGRLSISRPDLIFPRVREAVIAAGFRIERLASSSVFATGRVTVSNDALNDVHGKGREVRIVDDQRPDHLEMMLTVRLYENRPFFLMRLGVRNIGDGYACPR